MWRCVIGPVVWVIEKYNKDTGITQFVSKSYVVKKIHHEKRKKKDAGWNEYLSVACGYTILYVEYSW